MNALTRWLLCWVLTFGFAAPAAASWNDARNVVDVATQDMMALLSDPGLRGEDNFVQLHAAVESVLADVVDFDRIARSVMARHYRQASESQRQRFAQVFRSTLIRTYARALESFNFKRYEILENRKPSPKPEKQSVIVDVFSAEGMRYNLIYYLLADAQGWKVTNVYLDGINLRQIFKNQFADAMERRKDDIDEVITEWGQITQSHPSKEN